MPDSQEQLFKRAFLVVGPESSGTKLVTQILISNGCQGSATNDQHLWSAIQQRLSIEVDPLVLRLSFPHGLDMIDLSQLLWHMRCLGYWPRVLITVRDWWVIQQSQCDDHTHAFSPEHSENKIMDAYLRIFAGLIHCRTPFRLVSYEALVTRPAKTMRKIVEWCGLDFRPELSVHVSDENKKWYDADVSTPV